MKKFWLLIWYKFFPPDYIKWPELKVVYDSILNQPNDWQSNYLGTLSNRKMNVEIDNATMFTSLTLHVRFEGKDVNRHGERGARYIREAARAWSKRESDRHINRLLQTDHNLRVQRIIEARRLLEQESTIDLLKQIDSEKSGAVTRNAYASHKVWKEPTGFRK